MIVNPVLPGFHPDPSTIRVGDTYVVATSTFEWFPGIALHTSTDLVHWAPAGHVLNRAEDLPLRGIPDSGGIWAPAISHSEDQYWVVYTIVRTMSGPHKDLDNYLTTAPTLAGPWSEPIYLNSSGFDPSLLHAPDGRRYLINVNWDHRGDHFSFGGVLLQEYDHDQQALVGEPSVIFSSDELMEGSHLFERNGWFYLMLAEGGTGYNHGIRLARSRELRGPYELDPEPLLTSRDDATQPIQKAGHGQLVSTPDGDLFVVHLGARPLMGPDGLRCPLGRETFVQHVEWSDDGWLRLTGGGHHPRVQVPSPPSAPPTTGGGIEGAEPADALLVGPEWMSLRAPVNHTWLDRQTRPGWVRIRGRESLHSLFEQSLVARRLPDQHADVEVTVDADPNHFTQAAGLVVYYNTTGHHALLISHQAEQGRVVSVVSCDPSGIRESARLPAPQDGALHLRARINGLQVRFEIETGSGWQQIGSPESLGGLSDEVGDTLRFSGTAVGVTVQDLANRSFTADVTDFRLTTPGDRPQALTSEQR